MKQMKKVVSLLLCLVMLIGLLPFNMVQAGATTAEPVDALVVISDLHINTKSGDESSKATILKNVLKAIKTEVGTVSSVNSSGDMFSSNEGTVTSNTDNLNGYIREVFPNVPVNYTWTDHDRNASAISKKSFLTVYDNYYVYNLSMGDLSSNDRYRTGFNYTESDNSSRVAAGFTATVPQAISEFKAAVANLDKSKPLFIVGHQPLFDNRNDNAWAEDWVAAINEVAKDMDVAYFSGHNHNYDFNNSATNKQDYYFAKGASMPVPKRSDWGFDYNEGSQSNKNLGYTNVTLNFTHVCAGYLDPATGSSDPDTRKATALAVAIYDDSIQYTIYDKDGVYDTTAAMVVNESVEREHAPQPATVESIAIEHRETYVVGDKLTVKATYSDGTTKDVSDDATFSAELSASGTYDITATYEGKTATIEDVEVYLYAEDESNLIGVQVYSVGATGLSVTWDDAAEAYLDDAMEDYVVYDLALTNPGETIEYAMTMVEDMDFSNLVVYHVAEDGTLTKMDASLVNDCVVFTTGLTGTFAYGVPVVAADYELDSLAVSNPKKDYFVGENLLTTGSFEVTATYKAEGEEDDTRVVLPYEENNNPNGYLVNLDSFDMTTAGTYNVEITFGGKSVTFPITVWQKDFLDASTSISADVSGAAFGVTGMSVEVKEDDVLDQAVEGLLLGNIAAYDIKLTGFTSGDVKVTLPLPEGVTRPAVYYVSEDGNTVEAMPLVAKTGSTVTFETTHFSTFLVGQDAEGWVTIEEPGTYTVYKYEQITAGTPSGKFVIVDGTRAYALQRSNDTAVSAAVEFNGAEMISREDLIQWQLKANGDGTYKVVNTDGGVYLRNKSGIIISSHTDGADWSLTDGENGIYQLWMSAGTRTYWLSCNPVVGNRWNQATGASDLRFFSYTGTDTATDDTGLYARVDGTTEVKVIQSASKVDVEKKIKAGITVYTSSDPAAEGTATTDYTLSLGEYTNTSPVGTYTVDVLYKDVKIGSVTLNVAEVTEMELPDSATTNGGSVTTTYETEEFTVYRLVSTPVAGKQYLIVNSNNGSGYGLDSDTTGYTTTALTDTTGYYTDWNSTTNNGTAFDKGSDVYLTTSNAYLWTVRTSGDGYTFTSATQTNRYLGYTQQSSGTDKNGRTYTYTVTPNSRTTVEWTMSDNQLSAYLQTQKKGTGNRPNISKDAYDDFYISCSNRGAWSMSTTAGNVFFYEPVTLIKVTEQTHDNTGTYSIESKDIIAILKEDTDNTAKLTTNLIFTPNNGNVTTEDVSAAATYEVVTKDKEGNDVNGDPDGIIAGFENGEVKFTGNYGKALVKVSYEKGDGVATDYITIEASAPYYTLDLHMKNGDQLGAEITDIIALKNIKEDDTYAIWAVIKEFNGENEDGTDLGDVADDRIYWTVSDEEIAKINPTTGVLTFSGEKYGTITVTAHYLDEHGNTLCSDAVVISVSETTAIVPNDGTNDFPEYPNEGAVRHDKTATAVGNFSETGVAKIELSLTGVPFNTGNELDVALMLDHSNSMTEARMEATRAAVKAFVESIVKNEDGSFNNNRIYIGSFAGGNPDYAGQSRHEFRINLMTSNEEDGYQIINDQAELDALIANVNRVFVKPNNPPYGTEYDQSLEECYNILQASKEDGNKQFCVFMSDGIPNVYRYGEAANDKIQSSSNMAAMFATNNGTTFAIRGTDYKYEYWSSLMKQEGVTVFTVGLGLYGTNSSLGSNYSEAECERVSNFLLNDISGPAYEKAADRDTGTAVSKLDEYFFSVADDNAAAQMKDVFENIAKKILAAATDLTVADKIGDDYTMVFGAPNVDVDEADGNQEYYIEVTDYNLVAVEDADGNIIDYRRGTGTSLLKVYFGYDETDGYFAASDAEGTPAETPTFAAQPLGEKGTKFYWSTNANAGDSGISVVGADGVTYYFVESGTGTHNMTSGAFASGKNTTVVLTHDNGEDEPTTTTSSTCQNMIIATPHFVYNAATKELIWTMEELSGSEMTLTYFLYLNNSGGYSGTDQEIEPETYQTNQFAYVDYTNYQKNECRLEFPVPQMTWNGAQVSYVFYLVNEAGQPVNRSGKVVPFSEAVYVTDVHTHAVIWNSLEQSIGLDAEHVAYNLLPDVYRLFDQGAKYSIHVYEDQETSNLNNHFVIESTVDSDSNAANDNKYTTYVFNTKADPTKYTIPDAYVADNGQGNEGERNQEYLCKDYNVVGTFTKVEKTDPLYGTYYEYTVNNDVVYNGSETQWKPGEGDSTTGGTKIGDYVYYVDENEQIYTIVELHNGVEVHKGFDFANTTVAFAVVWLPRLEPDAVVLDYGLDVVVDVSINDNLTTEVVGVRAEKHNAPINTGSIDPDENQSIDVYIDDDLKIGVASVENQDAVRFSLDKTTGMLFNKAFDFYYEARADYYLENNLQSDYMYSSVTVIPATTIYYEDEYVSLNTYTRPDSKTGYTGTAGWDTDSQSVANSVTQAVDRPGANKISSVYDADNVYGYDAAYRRMAEYSMSNTAITSVNANKYATAEFTFWGTGFDVISTTSDTTGTITVQVLDADGKRVRNVIVDTYYGMLADGTLSVNAPDAIYQVPVMKIADLTYGKYTVKITAAYNQVFDHAEQGSYELHLDAIRIYDPTGNNDTTSTNAYVKDGEGWPKYEELRNNIISATAYEVTRNVDGSLTVTGTDADAEADIAQTGGIFIDCADVATIAEYISFGPNNELYLANNQAIAFTVDTSVGAIADVQLGIKAANGAPVTYEINGDEKTVNTATDMYYSIWEYAKGGNVVVIKNVSGGILSLTNIKTTFEASPQNTRSVMRMTADAVASALMSLSRAPAVEEEIPEVTLPEVTVPEVTEPEATKPEVTEPEATKPEVTEPEATEPEATQPEATKPGNNKPGNNKPEVSNPGANKPEPTKPSTEKPGNNKTETEKPGNNKSDTDKKETNKPEPNKGKENQSKESKPAVQQTVESTARIGFFARIWNAISNFFAKLFDGIFG